MKHAVILAHPRHPSLCATIAAEYAHAAKALGHTVVTRDLYAMDFDPRLKAIELPTEQGFRVAPDCAAERALLADVDVFVLVYPFWFNFPPAILKGYIDRVFSLGFGYDPDFGGTTPRLDGRQLLSFSTSGAPDAWVRESGTIRTLMAQFDKHLASLTGMTVVDHVHFGGIAGALDEADIAEILDGVRGTAERLFPNRRARLAPR